MALPDVTFTNAPLETSRVRSLWIWQFFVWSVVETPGPVTARKEQKPSVTTLLSDTMVETEPYGRCSHKPADVPMRPRMLLIFVSAAQRKERLMVATEKKSELVNQ